MQTSSVVLLILFLLMIGTLFASTLRTIARGVLPPELLFTELSLRSIEVLTILVPLSFFLGTLVALSQMYRNQEAVMIHAFGISTQSILRALMPLALILFGTMLVISLWLVPVASRLSSELISQVNDEVSLMGLSEGKFQKFFSEDGVIYVGSIDVKTKRVEDVFANISHSDRIDTVTAEYGYQFEENGQKYIALFNGYRNEGVPGSNKYKMMKFSRNDIMLPTLDRRIAELDEKSKSTTDLLHSDTLEDMAQIHWRLMPAISVLVLFVLAISLAKTSHREAKFINLVVGILAYAAMVNLLAIGHSLLIQGKIPTWAGMWWVYLGFVFYAVLKIKNTDGIRLTMSPKTHEQVLE
ncbi:MAG: LPS export ABC transporter permease LptF [Proteobacteria bacterium]|nr:LPS export ABC transporter permease LptF [Pseudomonadota bacterium]